MKCLLTGSKPVESLWICYWSGKFKNTAEGEPEWNADFQWFIGKQEKDFTRKNIKISGTVQVILSLQVCCTGLLLLIIQDWSWHFAFFRTGSRSHPTLTFCNYCYWWAPRLQLTVSPILRPTQDFTPGMTSLLRQVALNERDNSSGRLRTSSSILERIFWK